MTIYRIAIVSDVHAHTLTWLPQRNTKYRRGFRRPLPEAQPKPVMRPHSFITEQKLTADLLLCPGDIADRADPAGLKLRVG